MIFKPEDYPFKTPPFDHQLAGIDALVRWDNPATGRIYGGCFMLADEMGAGKTKQTIDAAQILFARGEIERVIVLAPKPVRDVWYEETLGEIKKHLWDNTPAKVVLFHNNVKTWSINDANREIPQLTFVLANYEFIRSKERFKQLRRYATHKTMLVLDESSAVKNHRSEQTKASLIIRRDCDRVVLLNGTPIANSPLDLYSQANIMDPRILACKSFTYFRARYAVMGGYKQIVQWVNLEDLQRRMHPYVLRRLKKDCLDLPDKMPPVVLSVALSAEAWNIYREMRDDMVAWLDRQTISVAPQAGVKALRLAQITSGFLGGISNASDIVDSETIESIPSWMERVSRQEPTRPTGELTETTTGPVREIGSEKLELFLEWFRVRLLEDSSFKVLVWCRFRPELHRLERVIREKFPEVSVGTIHGGQKSDKYKTIEDERVLVEEGERNKALRLLDPRTAPRGSVVVLGTPASGSMGLNLTAANVVVYMSNDFNLKTRLQSEDRVHRPGQTRAVSYFDIIATGPRGQKTIDHRIIRALRDKENIANWTVDKWREVLMEE